MAFTLTVRNYRGLRSVQWSPSGVCALVGPNGSGKTTLIDALTGFTRCSGSVALDGPDLSGRAPPDRARRGIVRTWQSVDLFDDLEVAENLTRRQVHVTVVEAAGQVLAPFDPEMAAAVQRELQRHGVGLALSTSLTRVDPHSVTTTDGDTVAADLVVFAVGVRPDVGLARVCGLAIGPKGGIAVDGPLRTSDPRIFAAAYRFSLDTVAVNRGLREQRGRTLVARHLAAYLAELYGPRVSVAARKGRVPKLLRLG